MTALSEIIAAKKLLRENGYAVVKISKTMEMDIKECEEMQCNGTDKDCSECSCSICIFNY